MLKGSKLKNTDWVVGIVVYTGTETKLMQNQTTQRFKQSKLENENNFQVILMLLFLLISSFVLAACAMVWRS